ncbi:MAG TPA: hypothetical protein DCK81_04105 [Clostridiales bacterium UBA9856]|nr:hypothetical protein [Clostridiales bacterium UBA9856]
MAIRQKEILCFISHPHMVLQNSTFCLVIIGTDSIVNNRIASPAFDSFAGKNIVFCRMKEKTC